MTLTDYLATLDMLARAWQSGESARFCEVYVNLRNSVAGFDRGACYLHSIALRSACPICCDGTCADCARVA